jgi:hypothetical protein
MDTSPRSGGEIRIRGQRINERDHEMRTRISCMSLNIGRRARSAALVKRGDEAVLPRDCAIILCHIRRYNTRYAIIRRISL